MKTGKGITRDQLWKAAIETFTYDFMGYFYEDHYQLINWGIPPLFLETEMRRIFRESKHKNGIVDKLIQFELKDGNQVQILVHIEVQGYVDVLFPKPMFQYFYRLYERKDFDITALAILTDSNPRYKPEEFTKSFWGTDFTYRYKTFKLMDYTPDQLYKPDNPFSILMQTARIALSAGKLKGGDEELYGLKRSIITQMKQAGYEKEKIELMFEFLSYYIPLQNKELNDKFAEEITEEIFGPKEKNMDLYELFRTHNIEQGKKAGLKEGRKEGRKEGLQEGREKALAEGELRKSLIIAHQMKQDKMPMQIICKYTGLSEDQILDTDLYERTVNS